MRYIRIEQVDDVVALGPNEVGNPAASIGRMGEARADKRVVVPTIPRNSMTGLRTRQLPTAAS